MVEYKEYICKHIIGIDIRLTICKSPLSSEDIPLSRKRERSRKATEVLSINYSGKIEFLTQFLF
jgi:hypothetical protein